MHGYVYRKRKYDCFENFLVDELLLIVRDDETSEKNEYADVKSPVDNTVDASSLGSQFHPFPNCGR